VSNYSPFDADSIPQDSHPGLGYQWFKDGAALTGATGANLTINNVQAADIASYTVVVGNPAGSVTSNVATLSIAAIGYSRDTCLSQIWDKHVYAMSRVMPHLKFSSPPSHLRPEC
jgi:hypothetical protein